MQERMIKIGHNENGHPIVAILVFKPNLPAEQDWKGKYDSEGNWKGDASRQVEIELVRVDWTSPIHRLSHEHLKAINKAIADEQALAHTITRAEWEDQMFG